MTDEHSPQESGDERAVLLKAAYAVKSPDDNRELYAKWAASWKPISPALSTWMPTATQASSFTVV